MIGPPRGSQDRPVGRYGVTVVVHPKRSIGAHCTPRPPLRHETRPRVARTHDLTESARSVGQEQRSQFVARQRPHLPASRPAARRWSGGASRGRGEARRTVLSLDLIRHDCVCHDPAGPDGATAPARAGPSATGTPPHTLSACPRSHHGARSGILHQPAKGRGIDGTEYPGCHGKTRVQDDRSGDRCRRQGAVEGEQRRCAVVGVDAGIGNVEGSLERTGGVRAVPHIDAQEADAHLDLLATSERPAPPVGTDRTTTPKR